MAFFISIVCAVRDGGANPIDVHTLCTIPGTPNDLVKPLTIIINQMINTGYFQSTCRYPLSVHYIRQITKTLLPNHRQIVFIFFYNMPHLYNKVRYVYFKHKRSLYTL